MASHQDQAPMSGWEEPRATALLVLANGMVFEGIGIGATGEATGEVCFNTAMTGYQEILTDPSYAGQIITFTFPHIGNVGTNDEDIETVNMASASGVRGVIVHADVTTPSNWRAAKHLDAWLKARGIVGLAGIDTRALTALIREHGMPNAVISHQPNAVFDLASLKSQAKDMPSMDGLDLVPFVTSSQRFSWDETSWILGKGYGQREIEKCHIVAIDYGVKRNILRLLADRGCKVTVVPAQTSAEDIPVQRTGRPRGNRCLCRAGHSGFARPAYPDLRHLPRPPDDGSRRRGNHDEDASGPPWCQPSGQGFHHQQGGNRLDEPRLCRGPRQLAGPCQRNTCVAVRWLKLRHCLDRQASFLGAAPSRSLTRPSRQPLPVRSVFRYGHGQQGSLKQQISMLIA